ncbi:MAG: mannose-1-phosphate guanylyltransferase [Bacteroidetes bacterium]|nr:MAG: mannose-1-phosphate guanylyltransferase [Bacteroidota bacterium]PIE88356.1 MAG: mannose-1-phosphate guanylyltransferase [Bacteroidota bacterium]
MTKNYYGVIMAGGAGTRFWPKSLSSRPKQFIDILNTGQTLIQQTFHRLARIIPQENIFVVTSKLYREMVAEQLPMISSEQILCEPMRRNTAPCIAYAMHKIKVRNANACMVVAPSDHIILKEDIFEEVITDALNAAEKNDWLLTLGIKPSRPDTGYGYIQFDGANVWQNNHQIHKVKTFTEKPEKALAETFLQSGDFLWNSGIFIWSLKSINAAFEAYQPEISQVLAMGQDFYYTSGEQDFIDKAFPTCKSISIDYGVMEKASNVYVHMADFGWSDLGTWGSLYENLPKDAHKNAIVGSNVLTYDTEGSVINVPHDKLVVVQGLKDVIVVEEDGVLLLCRKEDEQKLRTIVEEVKKEKGEKYV